MNGFLADQRARLAQFRQQHPYLGPAAISLPIAAAAAVLAVVAFPPMTLVGVPMALVSAGIALVGNQRAIGAGLVRTHAAVARRFPRFGRALGGKTGLGRVPWMGLFIGTSILRVGAILLGAGAVATTLTPLLLALTVPAFAKLTVQGFMQAELDRDRAALNKTIDSPAVPGPAMEASAIEAPALAVATPQHAPAQPRLTRATLAATSVSTQTMRPTAQRGGLGD